MLAIETFANFGTGENAYPGIERLMERADLPRRTILRAIQRLEHDEWIEALHRHRRATIFRIRVERLFGGPEYRGAKPADEQKGFACHGGTAGTPALQANATTEPQGESSQVWRESTTWPKKGQGLRPNSLTGEDRKRNFKVLVKLAHETFDAMGDRANEADLTDALKCRCSELKISYYPPPDLAARALDKARWQRAHRRAAQ